MTGAGRTIRRALVATGGTGGHIFPALAVAKELRSRDSSCRVLFLGGMGPEGDMAREAGVEFAGIPARGVLGKGLFALTAPVWMARGLSMALARVRRFKPQVAAGFGGYASFCPVLAARILGVPCAVHEQNSVPGQANRVLSRMAAKVFLSFPDREGFLPAAKSDLTGNPVRTEIAAVPAKTEFGSNLLVLGGSQGALGLNQAVSRALPALLEKGVTVRLQAGPAHEERFKKEFQEAGGNPASVTGFIKEMAEAYEWADLVLCRAGASTVFEVAAAKRGALFVPFPHATHDHQRKNAQAMEAVGAARVLDQAGLTGEVLAKAVLEVLDNPEEAGRMARAAQWFAKPQAAARIADGLVALALTPNHLEKAA